LYDRTREPIFSHQGNRESFGVIVSFSPDERSLVYGRYKGGNDIAIIRLSDLKVIQILKGHSSWINDPEFSNSDDYLVSAQEAVIYYLVNGFNIKHLTIVCGDGNSIPADTGSGISFSLIT